MIFISTKSIKNLRDYENNFHFKSASCWHAMIAIGQFEKEKFTCSQHAWDFRKWRKLALNLPSSMHLRLSDASAGHERVFWPITLLECLLMK